VVRLHARSDASGERPVPLVHVTANKWCVRQLGVDGRHRAAALDDSAHVARGSQNGASSINQAAYEVAEAASSCKAIRPSSSARGPRLQAPSPACRELTAPMQGCVGFDVDFRNFLKRFSHEKSLWNWRSTLHRPTRGWQRPQRRAQYPARRTGPLRQDLVLRRRTWQACLEPCTKCEVFDPGS
jgi:hypothetical protein